MNETWRAEQQGCERARSGASPEQSVLRQQGIRGGRSPGAGFVGMNRQLPGAVFNQFQQRGVEPPCRFHLIAAGEQGGVAEHGVSQKPHIALIGGLPEGFVVGELHVDGAASHARSG